MRAEISKRTASIVIACVVLVVAIVAWRVFGSSGGTISARQAGLGKPMVPGQIPDSVKQAMGNANPGGRSVR